MNAKKLEKWLLLEQSGELSAPKRKKLEQELIQSPDARRLKDELQLLKSSMGETDVEISPWTVKKIHSRLCNQPVASLLFSNVWKTSLALAACLAVLIGILNFQGTQVATESAVAELASVDESDIWDDSLGEDLDELENLIVALSGSSFDIMEM